MVILRPGSDVHRSITLCNILQFTVSDGNILAVVGRGDCPDMPRCFKESVCEVVLDVVSDYRLKEKVSIFRRVICRGL